MLVLILISIIYGQCNPAVCASGACSQYGWCGTTAAHTTNCQVAFSAPNTCGVVIPPAITSCPVSTTGSCGYSGLTSFIVCPAGLSCSQYGYCGTGTAFTTNGILPPASCSTTTTKATTTTTTTKASTTTVSTTTTTKAATTTVVTTTVATTTATTTTTKLSSSVTATSTATLIPCPLSIDGSCGPRNNTQFILCPSGLSCSQWGWCGSTSDYTVNSIVTRASCLSSSSTVQSSSAAPLPTFTNLITPITQCVNPLHVALTMDDGPSNDITPQVISQLTTFNIPVMFFEIGRNIEQNTMGVMAMKVALAAHPELFSIGIHTYHHWNSSDIMINPSKYNSGYQASTGIFQSTADAAPYIGMTGAQVLSFEISRTNTLIQNTYGVKPNFLRAPYGESNFGAMSVFNNLQIYNVIWSIDSTDFKNPTNQALVQQGFDLAYNTDPANLNQIVVDADGTRHLTTSSSAHGPIILSHDLYRVFTIDLLPYVYNKYTNAGKQFVDLGRCLELPKYK